MGTTIENVVAKIREAYEEASYLKQINSSRENSVLVTDLEKVLAYGSFLLPSASKVAEPSTESAGEAQTAPSNVGANVGSEAGAAV